MTFIDPESNSGSFEFTGAALALHTMKTEPFSATVSVDGWIRGQPTEVLMQKIEAEKEIEPTLLLSRANVPATIPMHMGMFDGESVYYMITDSPSNIPICIGIVAGTFAASEPIQIVVLHEIANTQAIGQPTWTVDGETIYGLTFIDPESNSGSFEFTGAALAISLKPLLHHKILDKVMKIINLP